MKKIVGFLSCCLLSASVLGQGSQVIIRERAKELRDQNNVRQGVAPPTQAGQAPAQPGAANPAPAPPSPALTKLKTDLAAVPANFQPSAADKDKISKGLMAVAQSGKPKPETASKFAEEVTAALSEKQLSAASLSRLIQEIDALLNPSKYPQAKPDGIYADVQAIFQENGTKRPRAVSIADALKAAANEARGLR